MDYSCTKAYIVPWLNKVKELNIPIEQTVEQTTLNICNDGEIKFHIISANKGSSKNGKSIVMKLSHDRCESSLLFTGDMEHIAARELPLTHTKRNSSPLTTKWLITEQARKPTRRNG